MALAVLSGLYCCKSGSTEETVLVHLSTGPLQVSINVKEGGRIVSLKFDTIELLSGKNVHNSNYGSTFWTSPQSEWGWPPPLQTDSKPYSINEYNDHVLNIMASADDLGYKVGKKFSVNDADTSLTIIYSIRNTTDSIKKVAPWEITRVAATGLTFFAKGAEKPLEISNLYGSDTLDHYWLQYIPGSASKLFMNGKGWLAHADKGLLFIKEFPDISPVEPAPGEEEVEIFLNEGGTYIELENQGAYVEIQPDRIIEWQVKWYLRKLPDGMPKKPDTMYLNFCIKVLDQSIVFKLNVKLFV
ncbi:MAG: hypothetical protein HC906_10605 [Bacteroidales bacterium]|nr:hypothetical protein [Bacteroidales bacterium]